MCVDKGYSSLNWSSYKYTVHSEHQSVKRISVWYKIMFVFNVIDWRQGHLLYVQKWFKCGQRRQTYIKMFPFNH